MIHLQNNRSNQSLIGQLNCNKNMHHRKNMSSSKMNTKQSSPIHSKKSRIFYKIPRVVPNQKERFYKEDIFRMHAKYIEVRIFIFELH